MKLLQLKTTKLYVRGKSIKGVKAYGLPLKRAELYELGLTDEQLDNAQLIVKTMPGKIEITVGEK